MTLSYPKGAKNVKNNFLLVGANQSKVGRAFPSCYVPATIKTHGRGMPSALLCTNKLSATDSLRKWWVDSFTCKGPLIIDSSDWYGEG